jgi:hypothetical protein
LDEAARSIRRVFIGSVAGSAAMLGVIGVAGAYGLPERVSMQSLSTALTSLQMQFTPITDRAAPIVDRAAAIAGEMKPRARAITVDSDDEVILQVPRSALAASSPVRTVELTVPKLASASEAGIVTVAETPTDAQQAAPVTATASLPSPASVEAVATKPVRAMPDVTSEPAIIPAPLVFEPPQLDKIKPLTELPKIEVIGESPKAADAPAPKTSVESPASASENAPAAGSDRHSGLIEMPNPEEYPKTVFVRLPEPKPPLSPAQLLDLHGPEYDKAEKCLAQAVYFEARAEPVRGQMAVAQVVLNRVFSPYYPKDVCSVVYQNAHRHLSCQFTFACDGKPEAIRERGSWARAMRIARQALAAKIWLPEVAKATHYHATYVRPNWIRDMAKMVKHGVHIFYRPRNWGDGSKEPHWVKPTEASAPALAAPANKKGRSS